MIASSKFIGLFKIEEIDPIPSSYTDSKPSPNEPLIAIHGILKDFAILETLIGALSKTVFL